MFLNLVSRCLCLERHLFSDAAEGFRRNSKKGSQHVLWDPFGKSIGANADKFVVFLFSGLTKRACQPFLCGN